MSVVMLGIKNCDTVRKARRWLIEQNIEFTFQDIRDEVLTKKAWATIVKNTDRSILVNARGTSWRKLTEAEKDISSQAKIVALLEKHPTIMKRPLLITNNKYHIGFKPDSYASIFK